MGPKKGIKMDLGSFLADDKFGGSWADDEVDYASISVPHPTINRSDVNSGPEPFRRSHDSSRGDYQERETRERKEFPLPENPPFKAKISNCPWDITEDALTTWLVRGLLCKSSDIVEVSIPRDLTNDRPKGFAFVEFNSRALLEDSLQLSETSMNDRRVFVNVAAPPREDPFSMDWSSARSGPLPPREERGSRPDVDWSSGRSGPLPPRESREPREPRAEVDWSSGRSGPLPPRESREPREPRAEVDWSSGRSGPLPPREPREPRAEVDWSSGRSGPLPARESREPRVEVDWSNTRSGPLPSREPRERKPKPDFDWSNSRSGPLPPRERKPRSIQQPNIDWTNTRTGPLPPKERKERKTSKSKPEELEKRDVEEPKKTKKIDFNVLAVEGDDDEDEGSGEKATEPELNVDEQTALEKATASLTVSDVEEGDWEIASKK